jgi:hypothetical protein
MPEKICLMRFFLREEIRNALRIWRLSTNGDIDSLVEGLLYKYLVAQKISISQTARERYARNLSDFARKGNGDCH